MNLKQSPVGNSEMWLGLVKDFNFFFPTSARRNLSKICGHRGEREREREREMEREKWALEQKISTWTLKQECGF